MIFYRKLRKSKCGFSLAELLLTAAILGYALSVMLVLFLNNGRLEEECRNLTVAVSHAEFVMEGIKNVAFSNVTSQIGAGTWTWNTASVTSNGLSALKNESISSSSSGNNPVTVTVTVSWNDSSGRSRSKSLQTMISG